MSSAPSRFLAARHSRLVNVEVQRYFCDRTVDVKLGRIAAADDFLVSPYFWYFMSGGIDGQSCRDLHQRAGHEQLSQRHLGDARQSGNHSDRTYAMLGLYNGDPDIRSNE